MLAGLAPAKINLSLRVLGRRPDGYHEVETLMAAVGPCDTVRVAPSEATRCSCEGVDGENLAARAADLCGARVAIEIDKRIPIAAGLGGGSSDAACVMRLLGAAHRLDLAAHLGADVPFFLRCAPPVCAAWATGTGTAVTAVSDLPPLALALVVPPARLSTAEMYASLDRGPMSGPALPSAPAPVLGGSLQRLIAHVSNDFLPLARARVPAIDTALAGLENAGALVASLSGKGPACFGVFASSDASQLAAERLRRTLPQEFLVLATTSPPPITA